MARKLLLICGIFSPVLYAVSDVLAGMQWEGYSFRDQTISELNAIGSPVRSLTIVWGLARYALLVAFGVGVWRSARGNRRLRVAGAAVVVFAVQALWAVPFASMHVRGVERGLSDTLHLVDGAIAGLLLLVIVGFAAAAFGRLFRLYSIATTLVFFAFAAWSATDASRVAEDLATPWIGVRERISFGSYHLWFAVFAIAFLRQHLAAGGSREGIPTDVPVTPTGGSPRS